MTLVLDASAVVAFVTGEDRSTDDLLTSGRPLHVPAICDVEVVSALVAQRRLGRLSDEEAWDALADYVSLGLARHLHERLIGRAFELTANFTAVDASYVALAEALDADLVTLDRSLARATRRHTSVRVLP